MSDKAERTSRHADLLETISIPAGSKIPDPATGLSTPEEYDSYFQILRSKPDLLEWSRVCLNTLENQRRSLGQTSLTPEEKLHMTEGMLIIYQITLANWVSLGDKLHAEK